MKMTPSAFLDGVTLPYRNFLDPGRCASHVTGTPRPAMLELQQNVEEIAKMLQGLIRAIKSSASR
jgi:hypothetical protein